MKLQSSLQTLDECRRMFNFTLQLFVLCCEDSCVPRIHFLGIWMVAEPLWAWWQAEPQEAEKSQPCRMSCTLTNKRPTWCHLLFYFSYYVLSMFRTLIYPSSGACDYVDELPHLSSCSKRKLHNPPPVPHTPPWRRVNATGRRNARARLYCPLCQVGTILQHHLCLRCL